MLLFAAHQDLLFAGPWYSNHTQQLNITHPPSAFMDAPTEPILPNLLLAGVQKAGTTAVDSYMREHDLVCSAQEKRDLNDSARYTSSKEVHYFDITEHFKKGVNFYRSLYSHCNFTSNHKYLIDSTPNYQLHPKRIFNFYKLHDPKGLQNLKIIFTVREPVAREMSWFNHWSNSNRYRAAFPKSYQPKFIKDYYPIMKSQQKNETLKSFYHRWFKEWFRLFDRQNILILSYDEIKNSPQSAMQRVHQFLDIPLPASQLLEGNNTFDMDQSTSNASAPTIKASGVIANRGETDYPSCAQQESISTWFKNDTQSFYELLREYPGPPMEQSPFPKFRFECYNAPAKFATVT